MIPAAVFKRPTLLILAAGVVVHGGILAWVHARTGRFNAYAFASLDCGEYHRIARNLVEHGQFSQAAEPPFSPDTWRTPGYPLFLAGFMLVLDESPSRLVIAQQFLCMLNVMLFFRIGQDSLGPRRAFIASLLFLLEPYHLLYSLWLMSTTLFTTLVLATWYCWQRVQERDGLLWVGWMGLFGGLLLLVWPLGVLIPLVVALGMVITQGFGTKARVRTSVFLVVFGLVVGTWIVRNRIVAGHFALSHQSGIVLAYFKGAEVALWRAGKTADRYLETSTDPAKAEQPHAYWQIIDGLLRQSLFGHPLQHREQVNWRNLAQGNRTSFDSFEISAALSKIGWSALVAAPIDTASCYATRMVENLTFPFSLAFFTYRGVEPGSRLRSAAVGTVYTLLALGVVIRLIRGRQMWTRVYFPLACSLALLLVATPQVDPRFRVPMIPLLLYTAFLPIVRSKLDAETPKS